MRNRNELFWSSEYPKPYYIIKRQKGKQPLSPKDAVNDHIANSVYGLLGVLTPKLYIGTYQEQLCLISEVMPGYKDLIEWFDEGDKLFEEINRSHRVQDYVAVYQRYEQQLVIKGKEEMLAAAILLEDSDVIGSGFRNMGLIKQGEVHCIVKIDPSEEICLSAQNRSQETIAMFAKSLSRDNSLFYYNFSLPVVSNNPHSVLGNLHFSEFFHDLDKDKFMDVMAGFVSLDDDEIKRIVVREEYLQLLGTEEGIEYLTNIANVLIAKREILKQYVKVIQTKNNFPLPVVFNPNLRLSAPLEVIQHGSSKPIKVTLVMDEEQKTAESELSNSTANIL